MMRKRVSNGKKSPSTQTPKNDQIPDEQNWKLLKFLCDTIEQNNKHKNNKKSLSPNSQTPKPNFRSTASPIPITGDILAKRKKNKKPRNKTFIRNYKPSLTNADKSHKSNHSSRSADRLHSKTKSLYTSALRNLNSPTRTSTANTKTSFNYYSNASQQTHTYTKYTQSKSKSSTPKSTQSALPPLSSNHKLEHTKSASTQLPFQYNRHSHNGTANHTIDSPYSSDGNASSPSNTVMINQSSVTPSTNTSTPKYTNYKFPLTVEEGINDKMDIINDEEYDDLPFNDPVQSLVTLVRRVTQIYAKNESKEDENSVDQAMMRQIYNKYTEFYHRPPVYPDHLRKFANKFQGIHVTYAAAKEYLDSMQALTVATSPRHTLNQPKLDRFSRSSISSPLLIQNDIKEAMEQEQSGQNNTAAFGQSHSNKSKITITSEDNDRQKRVSQRNNDRENLYAFHSLTDLELLQLLKRKINNALHSETDDLETTVHMLWEREYSELEKRLHKAFLNNKPGFSKGVLPNNHGSLSLQEIKRDTTYKSLKQMSMATDIDDTDHDAAVYLLKTYFPDDEDDAYVSEYDIHDRSLTLTHRMQKSNIGPTSMKDTGTGNKLKIKVQQQHIRSVTADKERKGKPALLRRSTTRSVNAHTETLSLYDTMVMKARKTKIKKKSIKLLSGPGALKVNRSAPPIKTLVGNGREKRVSKQPLLETIPSGGDGDENAKEGQFAEVDTPDSHVIESFNIVPKNIGWKQQYHQPYRLEDDDLIMHQSELTPEPPLFDMAFRQLTTSQPYGTTDDEEDTMLYISPNTDSNGIMDIGIAMTFGKQSTGNKTIESMSDDLYRNGHGSNESQRKESIPMNLLDIMSKYGQRMDSWDFDVFEFMDDPALGGKGLVCAAFFLFRKKGLLDATGIAQANLWRFLESVAEGYLLNPYHNTYHAVDVLLSTHYMFQSSLFKTHMTIWDQFGAYIAAVCHDLGHMGVNNAYYINTAGNLALLYGDDSVLENYHIAETFRILNIANNNWMLSFPSSVRRYLATVIRRTILATDLKVHGSKMMQLQNMIDVFKDAVNYSQHKEVSQHELFANNIQLWRCESIANYASLDNIMLDDFKLFIDDKLNNEWTRDIVIKDLELNDEHESNDSECFDEHESKRKPRILGVDDERIFLLEITIHACDVANPCKPIHLAKEWANRYMKEAFNQGDQERNIGIPVSAGMDRYTSKLPTSQIGFITFIVKRLFELYSEINDVAQNCLDIMLKNEQYWIQQKKKMNEAKKNGNSNKQPASNLDIINE